MKGRERERERARERRTTGGPSRIREARAATNTLARGLSLSPSLPPFSPWGKAPGYDSFPWSVKRLREHTGGGARTREDGESPGTYKMKTRSEMIKLRIFLAYAGIKEGLREMECPRLDGREVRSSLFHIWTISPKYGQF